ITLTGQIGNVMKESAQAALSLVRSRDGSIGVNPDDFRKYDIHVHVPAGAVPKDGPSAGVAMFTALASLFTNTPVRSDVAMTGEITLRGLVLPIGGLKEKSLAAMRASMSAASTSWKASRSLRPSNSPAPAFGSTLWALARRKRGCSTALRKRSKTRQISLRTHSDQAHGYP